MLTTKLVQQVYPKAYKSFIKEYTSYIKSHDKTAPSKTQLTEKDIAIITYANSIVSEHNTPLQTLHQFLKDYINNSINIIHILPFYPWDTDRGFSVTNYLKVKNSYGTWNDIDALAQKYKLMFDFVINHASINNPLVQKSLIYKHVKIPEYKQYQDFVITFDKYPEKTLLQALARPRPTPVLTPYHVIKKKDKYKAILGSAKSSNIIGKGYVWTTFSRPNDDGQITTRQVDLNFANPKVLLKALNILDFYIQKGAALIRLDAIGYIWKKLGSRSLHEPETHKILQIISHYMSCKHPQCITIAEVNEPQEKVIAYLGSQSNPEADLIYQFTHFPLMVHGLHFKTSKFYKKWLMTLNQVPKGRQFITVLGSHDGMGLKPIRGILPQREVDKLTDIMINKYNALPNYASLPGGEKIVYELCGTPWNLINKTKPILASTTEMNKFLSVLQLGLQLRGIPAIYINGLLGTPNYIPTQGLDENRTINREIFQYHKLKNHIHQSKILNKVLKLLNLRKTLTELSTTSPLPSIIPSNNAVLILKHQRLLTITNFTDKKITISNPIPHTLNNLFTKQNYKKNTEISLLPYQFLWLYNK